MEDTKILSDHEIYIYGNLAELINFRSNHIPKRFREFGTFAPNIAQPWKSFAILRPSCPAVRSAWTGAACTREPKGKRWERYSTQLRSEV